MAKRKRYKEIEQLLTYALIGCAAVFALYLLFAGLGVVAMKVITAIIAIVGSGLALGFLYMCGELKKRRSRWLVVGFASVIICLMVSLLVKYPAPALDAAESTGPSTSTSEPAEDPTVA